MAARPLIDPLADGVMETRAMMERFAADFTAKPPMAKKGCQVARAERNRRSTTGPGSPALANAISLSVDRTQLTNCRFCSTESCLASFGGISPSVSCSCTCYQTSGCCLTCSMQVEFAFLLLSRMTRHAVFAKERTDRVVEVRCPGGRVSRFSGRCNGCSTKQHDQTHALYDGLPVRRSRVSTDCLDGLEVRRTVARLQCSS